MTDKAPSRFRKLLPILLVAVALIVSHHWWRIDLILNPINPQQVANSQVVMYSTSWCGYCAKARKFFKSAKIPFIERNIENTPEAMRQYEQLGGHGVPLLVVNQQTLQGFNTKAIRQALAKNSH